MTEKTIKELLNQLRSRRKHECKCDLCESYKKIRAVLGRGDKKEMRKAIRDLSECLCNTGEELDMANVYIDELTSKPAPSNPPSEAVGNDPLYSAMVNDGVILPFQPMPKAPARTRQERVANIQRNLSAKTMRCDRATHRVNSPIWNEEEKP